MDDCILWWGTVHNTGYGVYSRQDRVSKKIVSVRAHRLVWAECFGPIPEGMMILHSCDVRLCVNPGHLRVGTHADNMWDKVARNRCNNGNKPKTHCKRGHEFTKENTLVRPRGKNCRTCKRERERELYWSNR